MQQHLPLSLLFTVFASTAAQAQSTFVVLKNGDVVPGAGTVSGISGNGDFPVEIADDGSWCYVSGINGVSSTTLLHGNVIVHKNGDVSPGLVNSTLQGMGFESIDARGELAWEAAFSGYGSNGEGVFRGNTFLLKRGDTPLAAGWPAGVVYADINGVQLTRSNQILLAGESSYVNPQFAHGFLSVLTCNSQNQLTGESLVAGGGLQLPGQPAVVTGLSSWPNRQSINNAGQVIYAAGLVPPGSGSDSAVMLWTNGVSSVLAREGQPSGVAATNWISMVYAPCAIGDGHWAFLGPISDFRNVLERDGAAYAVTGAPMVLSGAFGEVVGGLGISNRCMSSSGQLAWVVGTAPSHAGNEAIFVDNQLVFQRDVTPVGGTTVNQLYGQASSAGGMSISPNGRFVIFKCVLAPNTGAIVVVDRFGGATTECAGDGTGTQCPCGNNGASGHGCANSANPAGALLTASGTASVASDSLVLHATGMSNGTVLFFEGNSALNGGAGAIFDDGLRCAPSPTIRLGTKIVSGGAAQYPLAGDPSISIKGLVPVIGGTRVYQAWYRDSASFCTASTSNLTNAISVLWAP
jgi:hypothetical protein